MSTEGSTDIIKIRNINKSYGDVQVLKDINLDVRDGEVLVLLGPSGSGKSTLLRVINGLEEIQSGEVIINGDLFNSGNGASLSRKKRAEVGMVFQQFNLYPHLKVIDNVTLALRKVRKMKKAEAREIALPILRKVGLENKVDSYPSQLSGGEQQRVAIARSLAMQPKIMLFDEPTSSLDIELINEVLDTMIQLSNDGMTMIVVTHELSFARRVASRVAFLDKGEIIEVGKAHDVIIHPKQERTKMYMNKIYNDKSVLRNVKKRGSMRVGIVDSAPPMCYQNDCGESVGFDADLARLIADRLNVSLEFVRLKNEDRINSLLTNEVDACVSKLNHTLSRDHIIDYSVSYLKNCKKILMYKDKVGTKEELSDKSIAYVIGTSTAEEIETCFEKSGLYKPRFIGFETDEQAYNAMKEHKVDGYASDEILLQHYRDADRDNSDIVFHPNVCCNSYFAVGVAENDSEWLNEINSILRDIYGSGDYERLFKKWFNKKDEKYISPIEKWSD
jgi:ABC-type polar amino acid transport system ATPase subunit